RCASRSKLFDTGSAPGGNFGELTEVRDRVAEDPTVSVGNKSARAIRVAARACSKRAYAAFKSWLASAACVSIPSSTGSWNIFHQGPRTCASAGSADFQPPDFLYVAAAAALSGVLYAG